SYGDWSSDVCSSDLKVVEYALLAPALVLLLRRPAQVDRFLVAFVAWSVAATGWGFLQFVGAVNEFEGKRPGQREASFLGIHDFAAFPAATLAIGLAPIALAERRRLGRSAVAAGAIGSILAALGFALAGILHGAGAVSGFGGKRPGQREPSFLVIHAFAAFSAAPLAIGLAAIALAERRRLGGSAVAAGAIGSILAASVFAFAGIVLAAAAAL